MKLPIVVTLHISSFSDTDLMHIQDSFRNKRKNCKKKKNMHLEGQFSKPGNHEVIKKIEQ